MNRKLWFGVDLIATTLFAATWFLFPQALLQFQVCLCVEITFLSFKINAGVFSRYLGPLWTAWIFRWQECTEQFCSEMPLCSSSWQNSPKILKLSTHVYYSTESLWVLFCSSLEVWWALAYIFFFFQTNVVLLIAMIDVQLFSKAWSAEVSVGCCGNISGDVWGNADIICSTLPLVCWELSSGL